MRQLAALAVVAGAAAGLWVLTRARAAAALEFDELTEAAEALEEAAREHHESVTAYNPDTQTEAEWREQLPEEERDFIAEALERGGIRWWDDDPSGLRGTGYETGSTATAEDRATVAVLECSRAAELGLIPHEKIAECARELDAHPRGVWTYNPPGSRHTVRVYIGAFGHPDYEPRR